PDAFAWAADGRSLYFAADERAARHLFAVPLEGGEVKRLTEGLRVHDHFTFSRDGRRMAFLIDEPATPREVYTADLSDLKPRRLTTTNPQLAGVALGRVEPFQWKGSDGLEIEGLLIKPVGYREGTRYPLLTYVHGGPAPPFAHTFSVYPPGPPPA